MNNKIVKIIIIFIIISLLVILASRFLTNSSSVEEINNISEKNQREIFENFDSFVNTNPKSDRLSYDDFKEGFWYRKKNGNGEDIFFFNVQNMIQSGTSKQEILKQIEELLTEAIIVKKERMTSVNNSDLPEFMGFYNILLTVSELEFEEIKNRLLETDKKTFSDYFNLAQIYSIESNFDEATKLTEEACKLEPENEYCKKIKIKIFNSNGEQLDEIEVYRLQKNKYGFTAFSKNKKEYTIPNKVN